MIDFSLVIKLIGGLGLFLFGIKLMEDGLKQFTGEHLKSLITVLTRNRWRSLIIGTVLTTAMQSSSASTSLMVGLINAGFINLTQSLGFLLGANVGTTTTAQLMSFQVDAYALLVLGVGALIYMFIPREKIKFFGLSLLGLGMLFFGMVVMKEAALPLKVSGIMEQWLLLCNGSTLPSILFGVMIGTAISAIIHSGAAVGILITLASVGAFRHIGDIIPLILGCEIGTCTVTLLSSIRTSREAKKCALIHLGFNVAGAVVILCLLNGWIWLISQTSSSMVRQVANAHTLSSILKCFVFLPVIPVVVRLVNWILPDKVETTFDILKHRTFNKSEYLNIQSVKTPDIALVQAQREVHVMTHIAVKMLSALRKALFEHEDDKLIKVPQYEDIIDNMKRDIHDYIILLTQQGLTSKQAVLAASIKDGATEMERAVDHVESLLKFVRLAKENGMVLDDNNKSKIICAFDRIVELSIAVQYVTMYEISPSELKETIKRICGLIKQLEKDIKTARDYYDGCLKSGSWNLFSDLSFKDLISVFEKCSRHYKGFVDKYVKGLHEPQSRKKKEVQEPTAGSPNPNPT